MHTVVSVSVLRNACSAEGNDGGSVGAVADAIEFRGIVIWLVRLV